MLSALRSRNIEVFTPQQAKRFLLPYAGTLTDVDLKNLLRSLKRGRWIRPIERGKYYILPLEAGPDAMWGVHEYVAASHLVSPHMISHWTAANYHGLTEQLPGTIYVTTTKYRPPLTWENIRFVFPCRPGNRFFGAAPQQITGHTVQISDIERTLVDCFDQPQYAGGVSESAKMLWNASGDVRWNVLSEYTERLGNRAVFKRMGWLIEALPIPCPEAILIQWQERLSTGYALLDPTMRDYGPYDSRWRIRVNLNIERLRNATVQA